MSNNEKCIEVCNSLLRGEISAIETYDQAIEKFKKEPEVVVLRELKAEHIKSLNSLKANIQTMGGMPTSDSGLWGDFAKTVEASSKLFGENAALYALEQGEKHGKREYEEALENSDVLPDCRELLRTELLPRQVAHIGQLGQMRAQ